jgi:hypothetical protein
MHIYYRLMTRQNYQTVGKKSLTHSHSKRVSAAPAHNGLQGFPGIVSFVPINKAPLGWWE